LVRSIKPETKEVLYIWTDLGLIILNRFIIYPIVTPWEKEASLMSLYRPNAEDAISQKNDPPAGS
jgi:hypothetical protein